MSVRSKLSTIEQLLSISGEVPGRLCQQYLSSGGTTFSCALESAYRVFCSDLIHRCVFSAGFPPAVIGLLKTHLLPALRRHSFLGLHQGHFRVFRAMIKPVFLCCEDACFNLVPDRRRFEMWGREAYFCSKDAFHGSILSPT